MTYFGHLLACLLFFDLTGIRAQVCLHLIHDSFVSSSLVTAVLSAFILAGHLSGHENLNVQDAPAAGSNASTDEPCCQARASSVPIATYIVDIGLPLLLLFISYLVIR